MSPREDIQLERVMGGMVEVGGVATPIVLNMQGGGGGCFRDKKGKVLHLMAVSVCKM